jgi:hypothetical protein
MRITSIAIKASEKFGIDEDHWLEMSEEERKGIVQAYYDGCVREFCTLAIEYVRRVQKTSKNRWLCSRIELLAENVIRRLDFKYLVVFKY